jgi:formylglycine-generating enzyme required for sulfatase activity
VTIEPFWIGEHEVTWAEYNQFCALLKPFARFEHLGIRKVTSDNQSDAVTAPSIVYDPSMYFPTTADQREWPKHPAAAMTQYGAKQYTKWLSKLTEKFYRLPSEAEWEFACRAGSTTSYCFGDDEGRLADYAWYFDNSDEDTHPVGLKKPNRWGLYDMHGNVSEWVLDQYSEQYDALRKAVSAGEPPIHWPTRLHPRTVRGGSWDSEAVRCRSAARVGSSVLLQEEEPMVPPSPTWLASSAARAIGFRIARPLNPPPIKSHEKYWDADVDELKKAVAEFSSNGHSFRGVVDPELPAAIRQLKR